MYSRRIAFKENITFLLFATERNAAFLLLVIPSFFHHIAGGVAELAGKFHISKAEYGLCKIQSGATGSPRIAMISWVSSRQIDGAYLMQAWVYRVKDKHRSY